MENKHEIKVIDSLLPPEMARAAEEIGMAKASMGIRKTTMLAILAGTFIAFGAVFSTLVSTGSTMSWASRKVSTRQILQNWMIVYLGNMLGAFSIVLMIWLSGHYLFGDGIIGANILKIAAVKCELGFIQAVVLGILCNILVCLAIWLCYSTKSTHGKILAIVFPITAFVAAGFEHSVANMYFIPMGLFVKEWADPSLWTNVPEISQHIESLTWGNYLTRNLIPVTIGNIIGGAGFVGITYWLIYSSKWSSNN